MKRKIAVLGVPMDMGASKPGAAQAPPAIRRAKLLDILGAAGLSVEDCGDIEIPDSPPAAGPSKSKNAHAVLKVCRDLEKRVRGLVKAGRLPVVLGGDHSLAMGSVAGAARALRDQGKKMGVVWVDAHADMNTPRTTPSGNLHGMPAAHLLGLGDRAFARVGGFSPKAAAENFCFVGLRDVDHDEALTLRKSQARVLAMPAIDRYGMGAVMERALAAATQGTAGFYLSFDIDAVDPQNAPGTGTKKRGGLTYREAHLLMEMAAESGKLVGLDLVEVNPLEDEHNSTAVLAAEIIASALGKRIY
ncbi:MAG TPA: arginase [Elusimicrobiota bacterium]|nr:arginase [Elusimicrobiota bacterium]